MFYEQCLNLSLTFNYETFSSTQSRRATTKTIFFLKMYAFFKIVEQVSFKRSFFRKLQADMYNMRVSK